MYIIVIVIYSFMENGNQQIAFATWCLSSFLLAFGVLVSVVEIIHIESFDIAEELHQFRCELGALLHVSAHMLPIISYLYSFNMFCCLGSIIFNDCWRMSSCLWNCTNGI
jgi:hypothetical protein